MVQERDKENRVPLYRSLEEENSYPPSKRYNNMGILKQQENDLSLSQKVVKILGQYWEPQQQKQLVSVFQKIHDPRNEIESKQDLQKSQKYSQLSFEQLSKQFIELFITNQYQELSLDDVARLLNIQRRKTYDIINIMDSLDLIVKKDKNNVVWQGIPSFQRLLEKLKTQVDSQELNENQEDQELEEESHQKQLKYLSRGFIKLYLEKKRILTLEQAVDLLEKKDQALKQKKREKQSNQTKTRIRRLYDISNVFKSIGIMKKVKIENNKPAYEWIGIEGLITTFQGIQHMNYFMKVQQFRKYHQSMIKQYQDMMLMKMFMGMAYKKQLEKQGTLKRNILIQQNNNSLFQYFSQNQHELFELTNPIFKKVKK